MTTTNTGGFGFRLVGRQGGGQPRIRQYYVPATYATALFQGDAVGLPATGALDPLGQYPVVNRATTTNPILGVVIGFRPIPSLPYTGHYNPASTARYVEVCDDPQAIYEIAEDGAASSITAADVGAFKNYTMNVVAGSTVTGLSGTMLLSGAGSTAGSGTNDMKVVGIRQDATNVVPSNSAATPPTYAIVQVQFIASAVSVSPSVI